MELSEKSNQIETLQARVQDLLEEVGTIQTELEKKSLEISKFDMKNADDYLKYKIYWIDVAFRQREQELKAAIESKMNDLNKEHERTVEKLKQHEQKLVQELAQIRREREKSVWSTKDFREKLILSLMYQSQS